MNTAATLAIVFMLWLGTLLWLVAESSNNRKMRQQIERLRRQNQRIADELGIKETLPSDVIALLEQGKKISAIKAYREATGATLKQAKDVIDAY
ncbi:MAG: 50S ribosomal protein L7/L12 [Corynebacteriales bacterium]|nr:50S ribosomal protein L7/L12 [Mycobacteriales bacterium]